MLGLRGFVRRAAACAALSALLLTQVPFVAVAAPVGVEPHPADVKAAESLWRPSGVSVADVTVQADSGGSDIATARTWVLPTSFGDSLSAVDEADVYAIEIPAGHRLRVTLATDPSVLLADAYLFDGSATSIHVDTPWASTTSDDAFEVLTFDNTGDTMPCYLAVIRLAGAGDFAFTAETYAIPSEADNDIDGATTFVGPSMAGTVDAVLDRDDVYAITLAVGQRLTIGLTDDAGLDASVYVYGPGATGIDDELPVWGSVTSGAESVVIDARTGMAGTYYVDVRAAAGSGAYTLTMVVTAQPVGAWENVAGVAAITATTGSVMGTLNELTNCNDVRYMDLIAGDRLMLELSGDADTDFDLYVYGPNATDLAVNTPAVYSNGWTSDEYVVLDVTTAGRYYIEARVFSGSGAYELGWERTSTPVPDDAVVRLSGVSRYDTAIALSKSTFANGSCDSVVLASGENFPDALSAAPLAGLYECPLLLSASAALPAGVLTEIVRLGADEVFIVGGTKAVSQTVEDTLVHAGLSVTRLAGTTRYETAVKVAKHVADATAGDWSGTVFVVRGDSFADALAVAPLAYSQKFPILLTASTVLPYETGQFLETYPVQDVIIAGGTIAVSSGVEASMLAIPSVLRCERLAGASRYDTARLIAAYGVKHYWASAEYVGIATGANFPDALGGGAVCGANGGVLLLTTPDTLATPVTQFMTEHASEIMEVEIFGGVNAVSPTVASALGALLP